MIYYEVHPEGVGVSGPRACGLMESPGVSQHSYRNIREVYVVHPFLSDIFWPLPTVTILLWLLADEQLHTS